MRGRNSNGWTTRVCSRPSRREVNVLDVARALRDIVDTYVGTYASGRLINVLRFLWALEDIHYWCIQGGATSGGTCTDDVWQSAQAWSLEPGSAVHRAVVDAVEAIRRNPHFGDSSEQHGDTLIETAALIMKYGQSADHLEFVVWWLTRWG